MEFIIFCIVCGLWFAVICLFAGIIIGGVRKDVNKLGDNSINNNDPDRCSRRITGSKEAKEKGEEKA